MILWILKWKVPQIYPMAATTIDEGKSFFGEHPADFFRLPREQQEPFPIKFDLILGTKQLYGSTGLVCYRQRYSPGKIEKGQRAS